MCDVFGQVREHRLGAEIFDVGELVSGAHHPANVVVTAGQEPGDVLADLSVRTCHVHTHVYSSD